jgi:hypothetical protein
MGYAHARVHLAARAAGRGLAVTARRLARDAGQGTVEYVALILLVALVMAGVVAATKGFKTTQGQDLGKALLDKIKDAVNEVKF